jgi:hypothetical protein
MALQEKHHARSDAGQDDEVLVNEPLLAPIRLIPLCHPANAKAVAKMAE